MPKSWFRYTLLIMLLCLAIPTTAQTLSPSCQAINTWDGTQLFHNGFQYHNIEVYAGEQISLTPGPTFTNGTSTLMRLEIGGVLVATSPIPGTLTYTFPTDINPPTILRISFNGTASSSEITGSCVSTSASISDSVDNEPVSTFSDGRINDRDGFAPVVLYGVVDDNGDMRLDIYAADESGLLLSISAETIASVPECPENNTIILHDDITEISLYRLAERSDGTCPFQLNAPATEIGKTYIIIFDTLFMKSHYQSSEVWLGES